MTTTADAENKYLEDMPGEIKEVLKWYADARSSVPAGHDMADFAGRFLGAMYEDGAVLPTNLSASAPKLLALVLMQHRTSPRSTGAWLNLGFALRRVALYRTQDPKDFNRTRLESALLAFDRALQIEPDNKGKNIRVWTGMSFVYHMLGLYWEELECCSQALEADRSDPKLWLLYGFALKSAGGEDQALSIMNDAYDAYVRAGKPEELREAFARSAIANSKILPAEDGLMKEPAMGGLHRSRLAASKAHRHFVKEVRRAAPKVGSQIPQGGLSPALVGAKPLALPVSPVFEDAFGYRGNLRFLEFGYNAASHQFGFSDGGDDLPSDPSLWSWFLHHPVVSRLLSETQYPTLYGKFAPGIEKPSLGDILTRGASVPICHCLLLDRRDRRAYISQRDQTMMLFAFVEPEEGDDHSVFVDGLLMSPGSENYKVPPAPELLREFRRFLDSQVMVERGA